MMYSSNVVVVHWMVLLLVAAVSAVIQKRMTALKRISGGAARVAVGAGIERDVTRKGGAVIPAVCRPAGALATLLGIIHLFPR